MYEEDNGLSRKEPRVLLLMVQMQRMTVPKGGLMGDESMKGCLV